MRIRGLKPAVRHHVRRAVARLDPARYQQEPAYIAALFARLDDVVLERADAKVEFRSTVVADRGRGSAESIWGADFGLTASIREFNLELRKAVLGQAKRGSLTAPEGEAQGFRTQVIKMSRMTWATVGLEVPRAIGEIPMVRMVEATSTYGETWAAKSIVAPPDSYEQVIRPALSDEGPAVLLWTAVPLDQYLCDYLVGCAHGDRDERVVQALDSSNLTRLHIRAEKA